MGVFVSRTPDPWDTPVSRSSLDGEPFSIFDSEIDLREEIGEMIDNRGHYVIYRKATDEVCPNYDPLTREQHKTDCAYCMGTNRMFQDYKIKTFNRIAVDVEAQTRERRTEIGYMAQGKFIYYFKPIFNNPLTGQDVMFNPTKLDYILEVNYDVNNEMIKAYQVNGIMSIQFVQILRDKQGRIEYYGLHCAERATGN